MRHQRRVLMFWPAIMTVVTGVVAAPVDAPADGEATEASGESVPASAQPAEPAPPSAPPTAPATLPVTPTTSPPTTVPQPSDPPGERPEDGDEAPPPAIVPQSDAAVEGSADDDEASAPRTTAMVDAPAPPPPPSSSRGAEASDEAPVDGGSPVPSAVSPVAEVIAPVPPPGDLDAVPTDAELDTADEEFALLPDWIVRPISFPVLGPVRFGNDWGACRDDCARLHEGTDLIGVRMQPLLAAVGGTVTHIRHENAGTAGATITITGADGWYYNYFHVNNDTPGTDDGAAARGWRVSPLLTVGSQVRAGQVIAYMGDSGNSEGSVPHLHFEIRLPDHRPINPYPSLAAAQRRQHCAADSGLALVPDAGALAPTAIAVIPIDGGGRWLIDAGGRVFAEGSALHVAGGAGGCAD